MAAVCAGERVGEMVGMRAVDPEVQHSTAGGLVDLGDRFSERLTAREAAVNVDRERGDDRYASSDRGADDADGFGGVGRGEHCHSVGTSGDEGVHLWPVVGLGHVGESSSSGS